MKKYEIITDATIDLPQDIIDSIGIRVIPMEFEINGEAKMHYTDYREMSAEEFYTRQREGQISKTSQITPIKYKSVFEKVLNEEKDAIYIGFDSKLSGTMSSAILVSDEIKSEYRDRKLFVVDSLSASVGEGLLVYLATKKRDEGLSIEELYEWVKQNRLNISHWLCVEDIEHLKRGGRISTIMASIAAIMNIKLLINIDDEGSLALSEKVRGHKAVYRRILDTIRKTWQDEKHPEIIIAHSQNEEGAMQLKEFLAQSLSKEGKSPKFIISRVGPIVGSHTGFGALCVAYYCDKR